MASTILPITIPDKQLPDPTRRLSQEFLKAYPGIVGCWMPSKLRYAAADFNPYKKNTGTLNGGITTSGDGWGTLGRNWNLDGSTGYIDTTNNPALNFTSQDFSVFLVGNPSSLKAQIPISRGLFHTDGWYVFFSASGQIALTLQASGVEYGTPPAGDLYSGYVGKTALYTFVRKGASTAIYINQSLVYSNASAYAGDAASASRVLRIGAYDGGGNLWAGGLSIAGIMPIALTAAQVSALYSSLLYGEPYRLLDQTASERFIGNVATGGLLLARRRAAAA